MKKKYLEADEGKNGYQKAHSGSWRQIPKVRSGIDKITSYQSSETDGQEKSTKAANDALDMIPNSWWGNVSDGLGNLLFVDTEFTDLRNQFLISLGATTYCGCEFYAESSDYQTEQCSPFVKRIVLPLLRETEFAESELKIGERFVAWIESLHGPCRLVFDYVGDFEIIVRLFTCIGRWPSNLYRVAYEVALPYSMCDQGTGFGSNFSARQIAKVEKSIAEHFQAFPRHHALHDALAMKLAWSLYSHQPRMGPKMLDKCVVASHKCPSLFRDQQYSPLSVG